MLERIYESTPRYTYLKKILNEYLTNIEYSTITNIIIDLKEILNKVFRGDENIDPNHISSSFVKEEISSRIINIIAHYRNFFYKNSKYTNFFILYSDEECDILKNIYKDYKKEYYSKHLNFIDENTKYKNILIRGAVDIVDTVCGVIPNCVFVNTSDFDEYAYAKFITTKTNKNNLNIILSNDAIFNQCLNSHTIMLNMKGDQTKVINTKNAVKILAKKDNISLSSFMIPLILALSGYKKYSIYNISHIGTIRAINIINKLIKERKLLDAEYFNFPIKVDMLNANILNEKIIIDNIKQIQDNFNIITNINNIIANENNIITKLNVSDSIVADDTYLELNAKIFTNFPINIDMLLAGLFENKK